jgi:transcription-repair coupling factor (superfamily II helicase)
MNVMRIKAMCHRAGIARLDAGPKGATIQFHKNRFANPAGLVGFLQGKAGKARAKDNRIVVSADWPGEAARIKGAWGLARELAELIGSA